MKYIFALEIPFRSLLCILIFIKRLNTTTQHCHTGTGRCYWKGTGTATWDDARAACQQNGGDLAVMETAELNDYVKDTFRYICK